YPRKALKLTLPSFQRSSIIPEFQETLSEALPELTTEPITGVVVVVCRSKEPAGYFFVAQTTDGSHPNLWKDGLFKSKVARYLSVTRDNSQSSDVLIDIRLIDLKDTLPEGVIPIQETVDTNKGACLEEEEAVCKAPPTRRHKDCCV
uniref:MABP domain-containing protein n=1 Tax=Oncorhynchus tshawytscha TaxID=74940 RepID=A0AAZ3RV09_ONCTS